MASMSRCEDVADRLLLAFESKWHMSCPRVVFFFLPLVVRFPMLRERDGLLNVSPAAGRARGVGHNSLQRQM